MRKRLTGLLAIGVAAALACSDSTGTARPCEGRGADFVVDATDGQRFSPSNLTISAGQTVCWQNRGTLFHTVTSDDGPGSGDDGTAFNSNLASGAFFVHTFAAAGSFPYHCIPHLANGMVGTITVQ